MGVRPEHQYVFDNDRISGASGIANMVDAMIFQNPVHGVMVRPWKAGNYVRNR